VRFDGQEPVTREQCREQLGQLLADAVRARLMSDVPLGAFLSGGIDSSVVVALMARFQTEPVDTFSVGFGDPQYDELAYARMVARHLGTRHHELVVDACSPEACERLVWHFDEPVADPAAVPTLLLSETARRHVTVVLTGEGGDELFAGYDHYRRARSPGAFEPLLDGVRRGALPLLARTVNRALGRSRYHERTIWRWALPAHKRALAAVGVFTDADKARLYDPAFRARLEEDVVGAILESVYARCGSRNELDRLMYTDTKVWLADDLLMKVDKMSMAHSLEARTPYLDHRLVELMAGVPAALKLEGGSPKWMLREVARTLLPAAIVEREKRTFDVPIGKWLRGSLREVALDVISSGRLAGVQVFDASFIASHLWGGVEAGNTGAARQIWTLLNLALWARQFDVTL
jgi:asparagine synthase (glutamine-hydrolysing)